MSGLTIPCVSPIQILADLTDCVTTTTSKVQKRLNRLRVVCDAMKMDPDMYISQLKIAEEKNMTVSDEEILDFINKPALLDEKYHFELSKDGVDDTVKKTIEAELTNRLNNNADLAIYKITCGLMARIWKRISRHSILGPLVAQRDIILVHKGGIAQRLVLLNKFPHMKEQIEQYFGLGGDNDCNILMNPQIFDYDAIREILIEFVHSNMISLVGVLSCGTVDVRAHQIKDIHVGGLDIPVESSKRNHFTIKPTANSSYLDINVMRHGVFISYNDDLSFKDEIGRNVHFTLLRYKKAFLVGNRILGAEMLDISIPHKDEDKAVGHFHHYFTGQWITDIAL